MSELKFLGTMFELYDNFYETDKFSCLVFSKASKRNILIFQVTNVRRNVFRHISSWQEQMTLTLEKIHFYHVYMETNLTNPVVQEVSKYILLTKINAPMYSFCL